MCRRSDPRHPANMGPQQRREEVVAILASGVLRLSPVLEHGPEKLSESPEKALEASENARLSVTTG